MTEHYWAIRIGRKNERAYFALDDDTGMPAMFGTLQQAREQRRVILNHCGHKDVFVVKVELREKP